MKLKIASIVESISGEVGRFPQGSWCTIVRFAGCNLRCPYCDTKGTWEDTEAIEMTPQEIVQKIQTQNVLITGGEPLVQSEGLEELLTLLLKDLGKHVVQIETNGSLPLTEKMTTLTQDSFVFLCWIIDYKGPSSKQEIGTFTEFVDRYKSVLFDANAVIKMVVASYQDLEEISKFRELFDAVPEAYIAFSPVDGNPYWVSLILDKCHDEFAYELAHSQIILSLQMHKLVDMP
ncbi:MAG: radical SAM protein [Candidatus Pacebacteria bacterium]|jgi:7-carboxy-7-deazaguanine synthase|nr:radical SAM protein [Candidatus Paceibacterota bacterium]